MTGRDRTVPAFLGLAVLALALAATIWLELRGRSRDSEVMIPSAAAGSPVPTAARLAAPDPDQLARWTATSLARPLFSPSRRPPAVAAADQAASAAPTLPRIAGVVVTPAGRRVIFAEAKGGKPLVVAEGGQVAGFTVRSIQAGKVVLRGPDGERVLSPAFDPDAPVPSPTPGAPFGLASQGLAPQGLPGVPQGIPAAVASPVPGYPGAPPGAGLAIPGLPGFRLQPQAPGAIPGLPGPALPGVSPRGVTGAVQ